MTSSSTDSVAEYLLPSQAARILGVAPQTVVWWERIGRLRCSAKAGRVRLFSPEEIMRFKAEREEVESGKRALDQA